MRRGRRLEPRIVRRSRARGVERARGTALQHGERCAGGDHSAESSGGRAGGIAGGRRGLYRRRSAATSITDNRPGRGHVDLERVRRLDGRRSRETVTGRFRVGRPGRRPNGHCGNGRRRLVSCRRGVRRGRRVDGRRGVRPRVNRGGWVRRRVNRGRRVRGRVAGRRGIRRGTGVRCLRRQEAERIEITLRVRGRANPEIDVRRRDARVVRRADGSDDRPLAGEGAAVDADRAQVEQRHGRSEWRLNRDRLASARNGAGERDDALCRREHGRADRARDVDAAMLAGRVWMLAVEVEAAHDLAVHRPGPRASGRNRERERTQEQDAESPHRFPPSLSEL